MPFVVACPTCRQSLTVHEEAAGQQVSCPHCRYPLTVPDAPESNDADSSSEFDSTDSPSERPRRRKGEATGGKWGLWLAVLLGAVLIVAVAVVVVSRGRGRVERDAVAVIGGSDSEGDRGYMEVLELSYEIDAVLKMTQFWLTDYSRSAWLDDARSTEAALVVSGWCETTSQALQDNQTQRRKRFAERHGMDSKEWRPAFTKRYPERDIIFDEITGVVRKRCAFQLADISKHLDAKYKAIHKELSTEADADPRVNAEFAARGPQMIENRLHEYRMTYLRQRAPQMIREVQEEVKKLDSIRQLRAKVNGN